MSEVPKARTAANASDNSKYGIRGFVPSRLIGTLLYESVCHVPAAMRGQCYFGAYSYIGSGSRITDTLIGRFCSIAQNVYIGGTEHPTEFISTHPFTYDGSTLFDGDEVYETMRQRVNGPYLPTTTRIGHDVWIGANAYIKSGVKIGTGAVVGAASVVTRDVPAFGIVAGNPAKVIRHRFDPETRRAIIKSQWWKYKFWRTGLDMRNTEEFKNSFETLKDEVERLSPQKWKVQSLGDSKAVFRRRK